jgi:outer membrane protein assembly factor BamB
LVYDKKWLFHCSTTRAVHAIDLVTGNLAWSGPPDDAPWGCFGSYDAGAAYGNYYQGTWDGYLSCYDVKTGVRKWRTFLDENPDQSGGHNVPWGRPTIADGKIYISSSEHTYPTPIPTGNKLYCLDAYNGDKIWEIPFYDNEGGIASGVLFARNDYDGCLYAIAKGPSATTVSVQQDVVAKGSSVLIKGTVTDQSPGAKDTPAIADENMGEWMQYLYQNKPEPAVATGVPVSVCAIASDGTVVDIGSTTSTMAGQYSMLWTPPDEGVYRIIASFDGSNSYYSSWGETSIGVTEAPPTPTNGETNGNGDTEPEPTGLVTTELAIIAAAVIIAIVALVVAFWALRKRQ